MTYQSKMTGWSLQQGRQHARGARRRLTIGALALALLLVQARGYWPAVRGSDNIQLNASAVVNDDLQAARNSADKSLEYLRAEMDRYHRQFFVYEDVSAPGNHFHAWARFTDPSNAPKVIMNGSWTENVFEGATAIRCEFQGLGMQFGGFALTNGVLEAGDRAPQFNFGTELNAGFDLTGAASLKFHARGETGAEKITFFMGGVGLDGTTPRRPCVTGEYVLPCPAPDSTPAVRLNEVKLTKEWTEYTIDLTGKNLSYVLGGFGWSASAPLNRQPDGSSRAVFYLDQIRYEFSPARQQQRLKEPRFIRSFRTLGQPDISDADKDDDIDLVMRNTAFVYDNALALLAFLADGSEESLRRARLLGDAFVYAAQHDRFFNDGRLRSSYAAGDIALPPGWRPNGRVGTVPVPGFYDEAKQQFFETLEASTVDIGNNSWAMISLLALYQHSGNYGYLDVARRIGNVIRSFRNNHGTYQGFLAGTEDVEVTGPRWPHARGNASAEHNLGIYAAFTVMARLTGEASWQADAEHARRFVEQMWDARIGCYWAGTADPSNIYNPTFNPGQPHLIPLDVQSWSVMALLDGLQSHPGVLDCAERNHRNVDTKFSSGECAGGKCPGYDFNDDKDGVWFEGTAQMAVAYALTGKAALAQSIRETLRRGHLAASYDTPFGDGTGLPAAARDKLTTGFDPPDGVFHYQRRQHVGATAWNVFAQLQANPYYLLARNNLCGTLGFQPAVNRDLKQDGRSIATADFNGDGNVDLAVAGQLGRVAVLMGDGRGGFSEAVNYNAGQGSEFVIAADFNQDAQPDLAVANGGTATAAGNVAVLLNNGAGVFGPAKTYPAGAAPRAIAAGHFNQDQRLDIAVVNGSGDSGLSLLLADDRGGFMAPKKIDVGSGFPTSLVLGDFDYNGHLDIVVSKGSPAELMLVLGDGAGNFGRPEKISAGAAPSYLTAADFNKDGRLDLAVVNAGPQQVTVLLAKRVGGFAAQPSFSPGTGAPGFLTGADFNGDGFPDLAVSLNSGQVAVLLGRGDGKFTPSVNPRVGRAPQAIAVVDLTGDGRLDLVAGDAEPATVAVVINSCVRNTGLAVTSAASFTGFRFAPESIVSGFGSNLATGMVVAQTTPLPTQLAGTTIEITDQLGRKHAAGLFFVSPMQINFLIPREAVSGLANVKVTSGAGAVAEAALQIYAVAPHLFAADASGRGLAAGYVLRVSASGVQTEEPLGVYDPMQNRFVPRPIDLGQPGAQVFLILYGTGWRYRATLLSVAVKIGDTNVSALYAGAAPGFVGLDQLNLALPQTLAGKGEVNIDLAVEGQAANTVKVHIK